MKDKNEKEGRKKRILPKQKSRITEFLVKEEFNPRSNRTKLRKTIHSIRPTRRKG